MATEVAEPPAAVEPSHVEVSKSIFNKAKEEVAGNAQPASTDVAEIVQPAKPAAAAPIQAEPVPAEPAKPAIPDDVIAPPSSEPKKVDETIAAIDAMQLPKGAKPEAVASFSTLREKAKEKIAFQETKIRELEEKIGQTTNKADLEALQAKLTASEEKATKIEEDFSRVAFEQSPGFRSRFVDREKAAILGAKSYLEGTEVKPEIIDVAAHVTGKKRLEILRDAGIEGDMLSAIVPYLASYDSIQQDKQVALDNWKGEAARLVEENNSKTQAQRARKLAEENGIWESVFHKTDLLPLRRSKENAEWDARAEELAGKAKQIFNGEGVPVAVFAETIQKGVAYDAVNKVLERVLDDNKNLKAENAKLKSARPGGVITTGDAAPTAPDQSKVDPTERAKATFNQELAAVRGGS